MKLTQGMIQVYTGDGKGKTTAALGLAVRASGKGLRTEIIQFMKQDAAYGEVTAIAGLPGVRLRQFGRPGHVVPDAPSEADRSAAAAGLAAAAAAMADGADLVILDEVLLACAWHLLEPERVLALLERRPPACEVVLTGRGAPAALLERADLVTEMVERKHYYRRGVLAREGIEH